MYFYIILHKCIYKQNSNAIIAAIIEGMWCCSQAEVNIWATTYYSTKKSFMYITGIVLGKKARHSILSMAYKTFYGNLSTD